ncbi:MAG: helix-turn-helix domain-containing protein [Saprospiraceae bacterium]
MTEIGDARQHSIDLRSQFDRIVKALINLSPAYLLRIVKLKKSQSLLKTTDFTNEQIAYVVGFENAAQFASLFFDKYCITPIQYRRSSQLI